MDCLSVCGFAIIPDAYNSTTLTTIYAKFFHQLTQAKRNQFASTINHLRGKRREYIVPHNMFKNITEFSLKSKAK